MHLHNFFETIRAAFSQPFSGATESRGQWEVEFLETSYPFWYQNVTNGKFMLFNEKTFNVVKVLTATRSLAYVADIVEAMNSLIQERRNHGKSCILVRVSRRKQEVESYFAIEGSDLAFFGTDLGQFFGSNVDNRFTVLLRG